MQVYQSGHLIEASQLFEDILARDPEYSVALYKDLGYMHMRLAHNRQALKWFQEALEKQFDNPDLSSQEREILKKDRQRIQEEINKLSKHYNVTLYHSYRGNNGDNLGGGAAGNGALPSQGGIEFSYRPEKIGFRDEKIFQIVARILWSGFPKSFEIEEDSLQSGLGFRYKPFKYHSLYVGAERLFKIGNQARNDWLLRTLYSWGVGDKMRPGQSYWNYTSVFGDVGYFVNSPSTWAYYFELRQGIAFNVKDSFLFTPHITITGRYENPDRSNVSYSEAGGGFSFKRRFGGEGQEGKHIYELLVQYKIQLDSSSSGIVITNVFQF